MSTMPTQPQYFLLTRPPAPWPAPLMFAPYHIKLSKYLPCPTITPTCMALVSNIERRLHWSMPFGTPAISLDQRMDRSPQHNTTYIALQCSFTTETTNSRLASNS